MNGVIGGFILKQLRKLLVMIALFSTLLIGCTTAEDITSYTLQTDADVSPVSLNLNEKNSTFQIAFMSHKALPYGKYKIEDGVMTCKSYDNLYVFKFNVVDDETLTFIAEGSTESIVDGGLFKKEQ